MSEQIREQISAFLDGELPSAESELLLKRMLRDSALRDSFGRYSLIGEAMRGMKHLPLHGKFTSAINGAIDGEPARPASGGSPTATVRRWWRALGGAAVAASVAVVAVTALQMRTPVPPSSASLNKAPGATIAAAPVPMPKIRDVVGDVSPNAHSAANAIPGATIAAAAAPVPKIRDVVGDVSPNPHSAANAIPGARLTNYVFAHSQYPTLLGQRDVMTDLIVDVDQPNAEADASTAR
jgi:negative regulator of sigma E activity